MATISRTRLVAATPRAVWNVLADFGSLSSWADDVDHSCLLEQAADGPTAVGTSRRVQVRRTTLVERITDSDAPTALGYDIEGLPRRLRRVANRWTLTPSGEKTSVTLTSTVQIAGNPVAWAAEHLMCRAMAKQSDALLAGLAKKVEGSHD
jgi:carbon monoxide dehydrogenase subunit G